LLALQYQIPAEQLFYMSYLIPVMTCRVRSILIESGVKHPNHNPTPMIWIPSYLNNKSAGVNDSFYWYKKICSHSRNVFVKLLFCGFL